MAPGAIFEAWGGWCNKIGEGQIGVLVHVDSMAQLKTQLGHDLAGIGLEYSMQQMSCSAEAALDNALAYTAADLDSGLFVLFTIEWLFLQPDAKSELGSAQDARVVAEACSVRQ